MEQLIAARTFCAPDTGAVRAGEPIPPVSEARAAELRDAGLVEASKRAPRAARAESED